jgi:DNA replication and repair protein RecF
MTLRKIRISNLRNLTEVELQCANGINLICGPNGSGKSSILEAVYILGRGRSFRTRENRSLIRHGAERLDLFGFVETGQDTTTRIGVRKDRGTTEIRIDGVRINRVSELARQLPITILTPNSHEILERGPQYRRRYLDLGVFHVEPGYRDLSERYYRLLQQRNAALRGRWNETAAWDVELAKSGEAINRAREAYLPQLKNEIQTVAMRLSEDLALSLEWRRGWAEEETLQAVLERTKTGDRKKGYTQAGPQRAELQVKVDGVAVDKKASRGQQKLIVAAMQIAQARLIGRETGIEAVMLVDDLAAELDGKNRERLVAELKASGAQIFITGVEKELFDEMGVEGVFHVEHGEVNEC